MFYTLTSQASTCPSVCLCNFVLAFFFLFKDRLWIDFSYFDLWTITIQYILFLNHYVSEVCAQYICHTCSHHLQRICTFMYSAHCLVHKRTSHRKLICFNLLDININCVQFNVFTGLLFFIKKTFSLFCVPYDCLNK